jgi:tetratricopeptide (TPR) repeat protein
MGRVTTRGLGLFLALLLSLCRPPAFAQASDAQQVQPEEKPQKDDPERQQAIDLFLQGKFVDAMPLFEKLVVDHPADAGLRATWAWCVMANARTFPDPELRKKARVRARKIALEAKKLGDNGQILQVILDLPEDGSESNFSDRREVDDTMKAAEADFVRGDFDKAREGYERAILLDPKTYEAALFIGDVYFKQHVLGSAGEWFAQAIKIDPNRETAYRYWGDALAALGRDDEARAKYMEAVVADPYNRTASVGLSNWLQHHKLALNTVQLKDGATVTPKEGGGTTITMNISAASLPGKQDPATVAWIVYGGNRSLWQGDKFKKEFPNEPTYRRTLKEETDCLEMMIKVLKEQKDYTKTLKDLDPSLQALIMIQEAGLLEPYVLFGRVDADIAKDYVPYRDAHRENVRRYLDEFLVPKTPEGAAR